MELFQCRLAAQGVDPLAHGVRHLAEPSIENVENHLAAGLKDAFLKAFLEAFFKGEFFEEGDVGHGFVGEALLELFSELDLKLVGQGYQPVDSTVPNTALIRRVLPLWSISPTSFFGNRAHLLRHLQI